MERHETGVQPLVDCSNEIDPCEIKLVKRKQHKSRHYLSDEESQFNPFSETSRYRCSDVSNYCREARQLSSVVLHGSRAS